MPHVLADLHVAKGNGPHDSLTMPVHACTKCFKIDSGNLIPFGNVPRVKCT